jgi:hypothetical protein
MKNKDVDLLAEAYLNEVSQENPDIRHTSYDPQKVDEIEHGDATYDHKDAPLLRSQLAAFMKTYEALASSTAGDDAELRMMGDLKADAETMMKWTLYSDENMHKFAEHLGLGSLYSNDVDVSRAAAELKALQDALDNPNHLTVLDDEMRRHGEGPHAGLTQDDQFPDNRQELPDNSGLSS